MIAVVGPTGSGKTALAVAVAKKFNGVIISADSRQVYRGLDIGTNKEGTAGVWPLDPARDKPLDFSTSLELNTARGKNGQPARYLDGVPQLLIDIVNPGERFTLNDWLIQAKYALKRIFEADQLPIIVGGTGLYVTALLEGYELGGGRFAKNNRPVNFQSLVLMPDVEREILYQRSDERITKIFDRLVAETRELLDSGVSADWLDTIGLDYFYALKGIRGSFNRDEINHPAAKPSGYDQMKDCLIFMFHFFTPKRAVQLRHPRGQAFEVFTKNQIIEQYCRASRQYIRRQLTWWRHHGAPILVDSVEEAETVVRNSDPNIH